MAIFSCLKRTKTPKTDCEVVTFSRLDYWSMLDLFDCIPVHDLVRLNGLASWWSGYVTKVCRTKRDITVQCGLKERYPTGDDTQGDTQDQFNLLKVTRIDSHTSNRLGLLLPRITSLEIIIDGPQSDDIEDITHLISQWSHQLVSLKIKCQSDEPQIPDESYWNAAEKRLGPIKQLLLSLNAITSLRRLSIDCKSWNCPYMRDSIDWPILSQLEHLYFHTGSDDLHNLRRSLVQYAGPNHALKQIVMPSPFRLPPIDRDLFGEDQLLSKFTMLNLDYPIVLTRDQWALLPNLTTVDLGYIQRRSDFMRHITGMQDLKLVRNLDMILVITPRFDRTLDQVPVDLPQLSSVTNLKILIDVTGRPINSFSSFKLLQLSTIFPNAESVLLDYFFDFRDFSSYRVVKWMAKIWNKISYRKLKLRVRRELPGVECTFKKPQFVFLPF